MFQNMVDYIKSNPERYLGLLGDYLSLCLTVIAVSVLTGVLLGALTYRRVRISRLFTGVLSVLRIIPSLAVLILCIPVLGVGRFPAGAALTLLALPPVYINTVMALSSLSPAVLETARGLGLGRARTFFEVRLPLALPSVITGVRICAVEVIASATIASYIGGGGIGELILTGLNLFRTDLLLLGGLTAAALAVLADILFVLLERRVTAYQRK